MKNPRFALPSEETKPHRFVIYLPGCQADGQPIPDIEKLADETARTLCGKFGGVTRYPATGYFESGDEAVQKEGIHVLEFFCGREELNREDAFLWDLLSKLRTALKQESMACSLDGRMTLIS